MSRTLRTIDEAHGSHRTGFGTEFLGRIDGAETVGNMNKTEDFHLGSQHGIQSVHVQMSEGVLNGKVEQLSSCLLGHHLPWNHVAVVLHFGDQDLISFFQNGATEARSHQVDRFGGAAGEDNFFSTACVQELSGAFPSGFVSVCGSVAEFVNAAMDIGMVSLVVASHGVQHLYGFLAGCRIVQVDQRVAVDLLIQDGKIRSRPRTQCILGGGWRVVAHKVHV